MEEKMDNNIIFKEELENFISYRIEESYKKVSNKKEYRELKKKYKEMEKNFINSLKTEDIKEYYYTIRDIRMELDSEELREAYLIGFKDNNSIYNKF